MQIDPLHERSPHVKGSSGRFRQTCTPRHGLTVQANGPLANDIPKIGSGPYNTLCQPACLGRG